MLSKQSIFILLMVALPMVAVAQNSGKISGVVVEAETGEPLPGATVIIEGTSLGASTDLDGQYTILQVPPGTHTIVASFVGFSTVRREGVEVIGGITTRQEFELPSEALDLGTVVITAEAPLVNPTATNAVRRLGREELENLPTRDPSTYYAIQPGVTVLNDEVYIRGGRPDETEFLLEGISSRSLLGADNVIPVIPEALEEIQVYAGGYSAEFGGANAGIVQQVLRTGGERLSLMAQYETDGAAGSLDSYSYGYNDLTLTVGGPLIWNQHRFFLAGNYRTMDNYDPMFWYGADLGKPVDEVTGDSAVTNLAWEDGVLPGIARPQEQIRLNGTLLFDFSPLRIRLGFAHLDRNQRINDTPIRSIYNQERLSKRDDLRSLINLQANYFITDQTFIEATGGWFRYDFEVYDPVFGKPSVNDAGGVVDDVVNYYSQEALADALGEGSELAELYTKDWRGPYTPPASYQFNRFTFIRPGAPMTTYQRREQSYYDLSLSVTSQQERHELKAGVDYQRWTIRDYAFSGSALASNIQNETISLADIEAESNDVANTIRLAGWGGYGYDEFMNELDSGPDGPKRPVLAAAYINDKLEFNDIIVNAGLRYDYFDMDLWTVDDLANPAYTAATSVIAEYDPETAPNGLKKADPKGVLQPRFGLSFPVTDRTVFHLQYGKFAQMPDMSFVYARRAFMGTVLGGQNFIPAPFAFDLDPIKSTQYEIGVGHQFSDVAAFDVTAFYRKTEGQLEIVKQRTDPVSQAADYNMYVNGDFAIARGLEFSIRTRRFANFMAMINYTLTDAKGTNSEPGGQVSALENNTAPPSLIQPLTFEERHRGSIVLDYRSGQTGNPATQDWAANLLFSFHSGHRFTRSTGGFGQRGPDDGPLLTDGDPRGRAPLEPLNSSTTPWYFNTDLRVEKGFSVNRVNATVYLYVMNLFNTRNIINVYLRTANAESDGFLSDPELSEEIVASAGPEFVRYYEAINLQNRQHYIRAEGNDLYATPRQIRLGVRVGF